MTSLNIIFAGTPDFAAAHLDALIHSSHNVIAVYTQPDRPAGRGKKLTPSAVKSLALAHDIPVLQPDNFKDEASLSALAALQADIMVVVAYGILLPKTVLDTPKYGCINVHGSLLPRWRGAAPIQRAIWAGDTTTGVTIMQMDEGLDTGPMLLKDEIDITHNETSASLYARLAQKAPTTLVKALDTFEQLKPTHQDNASASYAKKLSKAEAKIDWYLDAQQLERNVRAFNPWPCAFFECQSQPIKVWASQVVVSDNQSPPGTVLSADKQGLVVQTGHNALCITQCQLPNKKAMAFADVVNARADWFCLGSVLPCEAQSE